MSQATNITGRDRFDTRKDIIRTVYEAALLISTTNLHRNGRNRMYALYKDGHLEWILNEGRAGIINYDENADIKTYRESLEDFIKEKVGEQDTAGFIAMDRVTLMTMLKGEGFFDESYLKQYGIGIRKEIIKK